MSAPTLSTIADVTIDCTLSVEFKYESEVSSHPAESGADYTDNAINKPLGVSLDCVISATALGSGSNAAFGPDVVTGVRNRLIELHLTREPVSISTVYGPLDNMQFENLTFSKSIKTGEALAFKASFKQLKIITNDRTVVQVAVPRAQSTQKGGAKNAKHPPDPPPNKEAEDKRSRLRRLANYVAPGFISNKPNPGGGL